IAACCGVGYWTTPLFASPPAASGKTTARESLNSVDRTILLAAAPAESQESKQTPKDPNPMDSLSGEVVDESGNPVAGAEVTLETFTDTRPSMTTGADGRFKLTVPVTTWKWRTLSVRREGERFQGTLTLDGNLTSEALQKLKMKIAPAREISVRVVDGLQKPVPGATVGVVANYRSAGVSETDADGKANMYLPQDAIIQHVYAAKNEVGLDYRSFVLPRNQRNDRKAVVPEYPKEGITLSLEGVKPLTVTAKTVDAEPIPGLMLYVWLLQKPGEPEELNLSTLRGAEMFFQKTNAQGRADFNWIPSWETSKLQIWPTSDQFTHERSIYDPATGNGTLEILLHRLVPVRGIVKRPDGSPAGGAVIEIVGEGYSFDGFRRSVRTNADGTFEAKVSPNKVYLMVANDRQLVSAPQTGFAVWPDKPIENLEFLLQPAARIHGHVTMGTDKTPISGRTIYSYQYGQDLSSQPDVTLPNPEDSRKWVAPMLVHSTTTDSEGNFEFFLGPGKHDIRNPNQNDVEKFEIADDEAREFNFHLPVAEKLILKGLVQNGSPQKPVAGVRVCGVYRSNFFGDFEAFTDAAGFFEVQRNPLPMVLYAQSEDGRLGAIVNIDPETKETTIPLGPNGSAKGILIDDESDRPMANRELRYGVRVFLEGQFGSFRDCFGGAIRTDAEGKFELTGLVPGNEYHVVLPLEKGSYQRMASFFPEASEETDLGELIRKPHVENKPPTFEQLIQREFAAKSTPSERFQAALPDAKLGRMRVMMLLADPAGDTVRQFLKLTFEDKDVRSALSDFKFIAIDSVRENRTAARELAEKFSRQLPDDSSPFLILVADDEGNLIGGAASEDLSAEGSVEKDLVL
ncbi:MAG: carboxypeptidase regulatory-like domain-containing protein, partial [Planctomycetaceae bacterium]|nr:carboxypeptidase regulatory-like domain-containing protein [Planctomycetaceae bacterium]